MSKIPKKLTLKQAFNATSKPIARLGDLIIVQVFPTIGETGSTFMPSLPDRDGNFERNFSQPETENFLREIYNSGGRMESLVDFSGEALALFYDYRGGISSGNTFAGNVGDPKRFESDCREALDQTVQPSQKEIEAIRKAVLLVHKRDRLAANEGVLYSEQQKRFRKKKQKIDDETHEKWRNWQTEEIAMNTQFEKQSKMEQSRRLKVKHSITESVDTIRKRLA